MVLLCQPTLLPAAISFFSLSCRRSLLSKVNLLLSLHDFQNFGIAFFCALKHRKHFKSDLHWCAPMPSKAVSEGILLINSPSRMKSSLPISRDEVMLAAFFLSSKILNLTTYWSLWLKWPPISTSLVRSSLSTSNKSRKATCLVGSLSTCTKTLSSRCFKNLLDLFKSAVWYSQVTTWKLKSPISTRMADHRIIEWLLVGTQALSTSNPPLTGRVASC